MMLGDLYQEDTDRALDNLASMPPVKPKPVAKWNGWSAPLRGVAAGAAEAGAFVADTVKGAAQADAAYGQGSITGSGGMFSLHSDAEQRDAELQRAKIAAEGIDSTSGVGTALRDVSRNYRPDPATASLAESLSFDLTRFVTKAVGYTVAGGGAPGAAMLAADEGMQTADDLAQQGVDKITRMEAGAVAGGAAAAGVLLPVAAPGSVVKTVGLWAMGGPGAFMAQQAATRKILENANYADLAQAYDPLDPVGLAVSSLIPAGFAVHALAGARSGRAGAKPVEKLMEKPVGKHEAADLTPEQSDAVMTHNLTLAQDVRDATPPAEAVKQVQPQRSLPDVSNEHVQRLPEDRRQGMVDMYNKAEAIKPAFDSTARDIADTVGGTVKLAELKGVERAVDKVVGDYAGDPTKIKDLVRATLVVDSAEAAQKAVAEVMARYNVLPGSGRNLLDPGVPSIGGYRDAKFNVLIDGHVAEIQVNIPGMLAAKKEAHPLYKQMETMRRQWDQKEMPPEVAAKISDLQGRQQEIYDAAWAGANRDFAAGSDTTGKAANVAGSMVPRDTATSASKNSRLTGVPLRPAESDGKGRGGLVSQAIENLTPGQSGYSDTGTPSTSSSSALGPNAGSSIVASDAPIVSGLGETRKLTPNVKSVLSRAEEIERVNPDMVVGQDANGKPITVKQELDRIRRESMDGTDTELGVHDAGLLEVAANCALATGAM